MSGIDQSFKVVAVLSYNIVKQARTELISDFSVLKNEENVVKRNGRFSLHSKGLLRAQGRLFGTFWHRRF